MVPQQLHALSRPSVFALLLLAAAPWVRANDNNRLGTLDVVATTPGTGDVQFEEYTGSYRTIGAAALSRRDVTVADVLSFESGVQSRQIGGFGAFSSITMRAASAAQTGVYLDGILLNTGGNAVVDLSMLDLLSVESIEIYRGSTPVQLGVGAIGGAVNIRSPETSIRHQQTSALVGLGSFGLQRAQMLHRGHTGSWNWLAALSAERSDNDYPFLDSNGTPLNPDDDTRQQRNNAAAQRFGGLLKTGYRWSDAERTDLLLQGTERDLGIPEWRNSSDNQSALDTGIRRFQLTHTWDQVGNWNSRHTLFSHQSRERFDDRLSQIGLGAQYSESRNRVSGVKAYWEHIGQASTISLHAEARRETLNSLDLLDSNFDFRVTRNAVNASVQSALYFNGERLLLTPIMHLQANNDAYRRITRDDASSRSNVEISPALGLRFDRSEALRLRANVGRFYREPSFGELFGSRGLFIGNNDLMAEQGINADIGLQWRARKDLLLDASVFASWRDELIATVFDARGVGRSVNVGKARIIGVELTAEWNINDSVSLKTNLTLQDARSHRDFDSFDGKQLPGEAQQSSYIRLQHQTGKLRAFVESEGSRNRFYDQANVLPAQDHWLQNLGVDWHAEKWKLRAAVSNAGNRNVEDFNGLPRPGRAFSLTFSTEL